MISAADKQSTTLQSGNSAYVLNDAGIYTCRDRTEAVATAYESAGCQTLAEIQNRHFWYLGRHRFLLHSLQGMLRRHSSVRGGAAIDLGGGCGGWIHYLQQHAPDLFGELALSDASAAGLQLAGELLGDDVPRFQIDLLDLRWQQRWNAAFLLDVLEHIPEDLETLRQIKHALQPGGLLFVTCPAFNWLWSYNDDLSGHQRRYTRQGFGQLAQDAGLRLIDCRYFMALLGPLLVLSRMRKPRWIDLEPEEVRKRWDRKQRVPIYPVNQLLRGIFALEAPLGLWVSLPWGTSILGVFQKEA